MKTNFALHLSSLNTSLGKMKYTSHGLQAKFHICKDFHGLLESRPICLTNASALVRRLFVVIADCGHILGFVFLEFEILLTTTARAATATATADLTGLVDATAVQLPEPASRQELRRPRSCYKTGTRAGNADLRLRKMLARFRLPQPKVREM